MGGAGGLIKRKPIIMTAHDGLFCNTPVINGEQPFIWDVWASRSKGSFKRSFEIWEHESRESEPPYFGWLSTSLRLYPETLNLKIRGGAGRCVVAGSC